MDRIGDNHCHTYGKADASPEAHYPKFNVRHADKFTPNADPMNNQGGVLFSTV